MITFEIIISFFAICEAEYFYMPEQLQVVILLLANLISVSYIHQPILVQKPNFAEYFYYFSFLPRPYKLLSEGALIILKQFTFSFILLFFIGELTLSLIISVIITQKHKQLFNFLQNSNFYLKFLYSLISIEKQLVYTLFFQPIIEILLINQPSLNSIETSSFISLLFTIFALTIFIIQALIRLYFIEEVISLKIKGFQKISVNLYDFFILIFKLIQVMIFCLRTNDPINIYLQPLISLIISIFIIINLFSQFQIVKENHLKSIIFAQGFSLSIQISSILDFILKKITFELATSVILIPFIIHILLLYKTKNDFHLIFQIHKSTNPKLIQLYICQLLNKEKTDNKYEIIENTILLWKHKQSCDRTQCFCNQFKSFSESENQINIIIEPLKQQFIKNSILQFNSVLSQQAHNSSKFIFLLHYTSALNECGQSIFAVKQINMLLNEKEGNRIITTLETSNLITNDKFSQIKDSSELLAKVNFKLTSLQKLKSKILKQIITYQLLIKLQQLCQSKEIIQQEVKVSVYLFLQAETMREELKVMIIKSLKNKLQFFQDIISRITTSKDLFKQSKLITKDFIKIENQLIKIYSNYPSQSMQSLSAFFHAEIFNNFLDAYKIGGTGSISDEKLMNNQQYLPINLFSKNVEWINCTYNDKNSSLLISKFSRNAYELMKYRQEDFNKLTQIEQLMPIFIKDIHMNYVDNFLQTGISKFYDNVDISFCQQQNGFIHPIEMFYTVNPLSSQNIDFIIFFQLMQTQNIYIMLDENYLIGGVSQNLLQHMHYSQNIINYIDIRKLLSGVHIFLLIPTIQQLLKGSKIFDSHQVKQQNFQLNFLKEEILKIYYLNSIDSCTFHREINQSFPLLWKNQQNLNNFSCSLTITLNNYGKSHHYIIHIYEIRQELTSQAQGIEQQVRESISIKTKTRIKNKKCDLESFSHLSNGSSFNREFEIVKKVNINEDPINEVKESLLNKNQTAFFSKQPTGDQKEYQKVIQLYNNDFELSQGHQINSRANLLITTDQTKRITQQRFFQDDYTHPIVPVQRQSDIVDINDLSAKIEIKYNAKDLNQQMHNFIIFGDKSKAKDQEYDQQENQSSSQSEIGIRKSIFSKHYEIIQRIIRSKKLPPQMQGMIFFMILMLLITFVYSIISLLTVQYDVKKFSQQSDMLSIRAFFMGPFDEFMTTRFRLFIYGNMLKAGQMNQSRYDFLKIFPRYQLALGFENLHTNFIKQLDNPLLYEFIKEKQMEVKLMRTSQTDLQHYNVSLRGSLNILLNYQYMYKIAYQQNRSITGTTYFVYQYTNYLLLIETFTELSETIKLFVSSITQQLNIKWVQFWIIFLVIAFILNFLSLIFLRLFFKRYERILELFSFIDIYWVNRDLERYKILISFLKKDEDVIYKYTFNLQKKETFIMSEKEKYDQIMKLKSKNKKEQLQIKNFELKFIFNYIVYFMIFAIFFILSTSQTIIIFTFLNKYQSSADLYKEMSELRYNIPGPFAQRDMCYNFNIFVFFKPSDRDYYLDLFLKGLEKQDRFIEFISNFDPSKYIISQEYIDRLLELREGDVCKYLPEVSYNQLIYYLKGNEKFEFGGVMKRGLISTLLALDNTLKNEVKVNNFTKRIGDPIQDSEVALISVYVVNNLTSMMKDGMNQITQNIIDQANMISLFYLVYAIIILLSLFFFATYYYKSELQIVKKFIYLLPQSLLFVDYSLERQLKIIAIGEPTD